MRNQGKRTLPPITMTSLIKDRVGDCIGSPLALSCGAIFKKDRNALSAGRVSVSFLLQLLRMFHTVLGITAPKPEHERAYLLAWTGALVLVILTMIGFALLIVPRIMR